MKTTQACISIRVEKDLKQRFYQLCEEFGLSAATAFNIFMKTVVRERKIPFEIASPSEEEKLINKYLSNFEEMRQSVADAEVEMSLEEINALIKSVRDERKQ